MQLSVACRGIPRVRRTSRGYALCSFEQTLLVGTISLQILFFSFRNRKKRLSNDNPCTDLSVIIHIATFFTSNWTLGFVIVCFSLTLFPTNICPPPDIGTSCVTIEASSSVLLEKGVPESLLTNIQDACSSASNVSQAINFLCPIASLIQSFEPCTIQRLTLGVSYFC